VYLSFSLSALNCAEESHDRPVIRLPRISPIERIAIGLRHTLIAALGLASLALPSGCGGACGPEDRVYLVRAPDAQTQMLIDACADPLRMDCLPLCERLRGMSFSPDPIVHCELHRGVDGYSEVHVQWRLSCL
jgi:hypothetical protein